MTKRMKMADLGGEGGQHGETGQWWDWQGGKLGENILVGFEL